MSGRWHWPEIGWLKTQASVGMKMILEAQYDYQG